MPDSRLGGGACVSIPSSPIWREGLGGGVVTFLVAEWPRGRGWVVMVIEILFVGGRCAFPPPALKSQLLLVIRRAQLVHGLLGGRGWTSVPRGHRARGEVPRSLKTAGLSKMHLRFVPIPTPSTGCILAYFHPPSFHISPVSQAGPLSPSWWTLITALACLS